jgi:outer membrane protein TolC
MIENLVQKNPIFIENQKELEAAKMKIKAAKSDYLPTISAISMVFFFNKNLKEDLTTNFSTQFNQNKNLKFLWAECSSVSKISGKKCC